MGLLDWFKKSKDTPELDREQSMQSVPMINQLITVEYDAEGNAVLNVPRKRTTMVKLMAKLFRLPPYKQIELDELGTYTIELCDGEHTVEEIIEKFADRFDLSHREAEVSMLSYLQTLAKRGIIAFAVPEDSEQ
jgi:hypothetical protein